MPQVRQLLNSARYLVDSSDSAELDCELLLCHALNVDRAWLRTWPKAVVSTEQSDYFNSLIESRQAGTPIAYLLGSQGFWTLNLKVTADTLIPRPETELLVEIALKLELPKSSRVLDMGTGSGAIALALASEREQWQVTAIDSQPEAIKVAIENRQRNNLSNVEIFHSHWFEQLAQPPRKFDLIVSNPPYIEKNDPHLLEGDVRFEPKTALIADGDGLQDLKHIISQGIYHLVNGGWLLVEHGCDQGMPVRDLFTSVGFVEVATLDDYNGLPRVTLGQWL